MQYKIQINGNNIEINIKRRLPISYPIKDLELQRGTIYSDVAMRLFDKSILDFDLHCELAKKAIQLYPNKRQMWIDSVLYIEMSNYARGKPKNYKYKNYKELNLKAENIDDILDEDDKINDIISDEVYKKEILEQILIKLKS